MCGIFGVISLSKSFEIDKKILKNLLTIWIIEDLMIMEIFFCEKFAFGHRRLSIIDLSQNGKQPMFSYDNSSTITYNGEIYNYKELKNF